MTSECLRNCYRHEINDDAKEADNNDNMVNNKKKTTSKSFKYKTKMKETTLRNYNNRLNAETVVPFRYLSTFWRSLNLSVINSEIEFALSWSKYCALPEISRTFRKVDPNANPVMYEVATATSGVTFQINVKFYVPVVTLSINDNIKFLENIMQGFKETISWNK